MMLLLLLKLSRYFFSLIIASEAFKIRKPSTWSSTIAATIAAKALEVRKLLFLSTIIAGKAHYKLL